MASLFAAFQMNSQSDDNVSKKKTYTVGLMRNLFYDVELNDAKAAIKVWINEIVKTYYNREEYNIKAKIYNSVNEVKESMKADSLTMLSMNTYDFLKYGNEIGLKPVLVGAAEGDIYAQYYILVRNENKIKNIKDLKGTNIGLMSSQNHIASRMWLDILLANNNIADKSKYFKSIISVDKESQLILSVFFGHLDACIVTTGALEVMRELNPQVKEKILPLQTSAKYLWGVLSITGRYADDKERQAFYLHAQHIHELVTGKQLFSLLKIEKLVTFKSDFLNSYRDLIKEYNFLVKKNKIKGEASN